MADTSDGDIAVTIKAVFSDFVQGLKELSSGVKEHTEGMKHSFESLNEGIEKVRGAFIAITAVLAGGKAFSESVGAAEKFAFAVQDLSERLGITTQEASGLKLALDDIGMSSEAYEGLVMRLSRQIRTQSEELEKMGLKVRDSNGQLRPMNEIMADSIKLIGQYAAGTDRNIAMQVAFGRGAGVTYDQLRRLAATMEEGSETARKLGLELGTNDVAAMREYQKSMNDAKDVMEAVEIKVGQALIPALKSLSDWFSEYGPTAFNIFKAAFEPFIGVFELMKNGLETIATTVVAFFGTLKTAASLGWQAIKDAISGNALKAEADWAVATIKIREIWASASKDIIDNAKRTSDEIMKIGQPDARKGSGDAGPGGGKSASGLLSNTGGATQFEQWKAALEQMKQDQQAYFKDFTNEEITFWQSKLAIVAKGSKDEIEIRSQLYQLHKQQAQQALAEELATIKTRIDAVKGDYEKQELLATDAANKIGAAYGFESAQYARATQEILKYAEQRQQQLDQIAIEEIEAKRAHNESMISLEQEHANHLLAIGVINDQQYLAQERDIKEAEYELELASLEDKLNFLDAWSDAYRQTLDKIRAMVDDHNVELKKQDDKALEERIKTIDGYFAPVNSAIEQSINGMIQGTQTMQKAMANIGQSIVAEFIKIGVTKVTHWIATELAMTSATAAGETARAGIKTAGAAAGKAAETASGLSTIMKDAYQAAAGAYSATVGIPFVGPVLAPIAAGVAFAAVAAFGSGLSSAAGGYDIPAGVNPVTQLHAREMVLPAAQADVIRGLADGSLRAGGGSINVHVTAMDSRDVVRSLQSGGALHKAIKSLGRDFVFT